MKSSEKITEIKFSRKIVAAVMAVLYLVASSPVAAFAEDYFGIDIYNAETAAALGIGDDEEFSADTHADVIFYGDYALLDCAENSDGTYTMVVQTIIDLEGLFPPGEDKITRISTVKFSYDNKNVHFISAEYTQDGEKIP